MSIATVVIKDVEVGAEKLLSWLGDAGKVLTKAESVEPQVVAALGTVLGAVGAVVEDAAAVAANPATLTISLGADIKAVAAVWPDVKAFAATLGIKL